MAEKKPYRAYLYASKKPDSQQEEQLKAFIGRRYAKEYDIVWVQDDELENGFKLVVGDDVYDHSRQGRFAQLKEILEDVVRRDDDSSDVISLFKTAIDSWNVETVSREEGEVLTIGDGIAIIKGLDKAVYGEIVVFESGVKGMVQDIRRDDLGVILFGDDTGVREGSRVRRTKKTAGIPVGDAYLGRVVNALGEAVDGGGPIQAADYRAVESPAPGIVERQAVNTSMYTGILSIDSMFPIGRGQRELIIGDRQTGKTSIAMDAILNQEDVICIYVAIGQKASSISRLVETLKKKGAMKHTVVVSATASDTAPVQYIAPYAGTALAEYFMYQGKDVLIVYDDLSKHAVAYRALSLLLERSPGREAYPGDVFYLHSRLLERSAHLSDELGGGSITALPIVETQEGDVSAYIPTNIISITDGQIFLESSLFFSGQRPAVNVGLSVSRVGGAAQTKAMKAAAGSLRLDLAQYREMEVFTQFSSDLDESTKKQLRYGQGLMQILRQPTGKPYALHSMVILLVTATSQLLMDIEIKQIKFFIEDMLIHFQSMHAPLCMEIDRSGKLSDEVREEIKKIAREFLKTWQTPER